MQFFVGLHQPSDAKRFARAFISVNRLKPRRSLDVGEWIMDSGAFSTILRHGGYPDPVRDYAREIHRWKNVGTLLAAVTQDYMCEPAMLKMTGLTIAEHQRLTIRRYDLLRSYVPDVYIMPVLQGYEPRDYVRHLHDYGDRLAHGAWVGVGSICKRNAHPFSVARILSAIKRARPDLQLHGFGLKLTALKSARIRSLLATADSMAWSFSARRQGRNPNDWREARRFVRAIEHLI